MYEPPVGGGARPALLRTLAAIMACGVSGNGRRRAWIRVSSAVALFSGALASLTTALFGPAAAGRGMLVTISPAPDGPCCERSAGTGYAALGAMATPMEDTGHATASLRATGIRGEAGGI